MLGAEVPAALHDAHPPVLAGTERQSVDEATDVAIQEALAASFRVR